MPSESQVQGFSQNVGAEADSDDILRILYILYFDIFVCLLGTLVGLDLLSAARLFTYTLSYHISPELSPPQVFIVSAFQQSQR